MKDAYDFTHATRGPVMQTAGKTRISIFIDDDVLAAYREQAGTLGKGYQTLINDTLRAALDPASTPATRAQMDKLIKIVESAMAANQRPGLKPHGARKPKGGMAPSVA